MGSWKKRLAYHINNKYYNGDELMLQESWTNIQKYIQMQA